MLFLKSVHGLDVVELHVPFGGIRNKSLLHTLQEHLDLFEVTTNRAIIPSGMAMYIASVRKLTLSHETASLTRNHAYEQSFEAIIWDFIVSAVE